VGANLGHWSERFAKNLGKDGVGLLIEPSPSAQARLRKLIAGFECSAILVAAGASDELGEAVFHAEHDAGSDHRSSMGSAVTTQSPSGCH
jgi:FkbM family methyltransferase